MGLFTCISLVVVVAAYAYGSEYAASTGCYDCNFAPSGHVKGFRGWANGSEVGYLKCGLTSPADRFFVYKHQCQSGRCYIRREENGMVYRGCADTANLPWDVNTDVNCKYQGPSKSLWWFCDGDCCNNGQMGEDEDRCGSPPAPSYDHAATADAYDQPLSDPTYGDNGATYGDNGATYGNQGATYGDQGAHHGGYGNQGNYGNYGSQGGNQGGYGSYGGYAHNRFGHRLVGLSLHQGHGYNNRDHYPTEATRVGDYAEPKTTAKYEEYNPCDGHCYNNPSGLYEDPARRDHFIQCGCASKNGYPCTCCKAFYLSCPENTEFDDSMKVCTRPNKPY